MIAVSRGPRADGLNGAADYYIESHPTMVAGGAVLPSAAGHLHAVPGVWQRAAVLPGVWHALGVVAPGAHCPRYHRHAGMDRADLHGEVPLGPDCRPGAAAG